jgi:hypothetical protein
MASAERLLVSTCFVTYFYRIPLHSIPIKTNIYIVLQNENNVYFLAIIENNGQLTRLYGGRNHKWHSMQAGILKNCDE